MKNAQVALSHKVTFFRRQVKPVMRCFVVQFYAFAVKVHETEDVLHGGIARFSQWQETFIGGDGFCTGGNPDQPVLGCVHCSRYHLKGRNKHQALGKETHCCSHSMSSVAGEGRVIPEVTGYNSFSTSFID